jgi:hypothetical protein
MDGEPEDQKSLGNLPVFFYLVNKLGMVKQGFHSGLSNTKGDQLAC